MVSYVGFQGFFERGTFMRRDGLIPYHADLVVIVI